MSEQRPVSYTHLYYNRNAPTVSDAVYDRLYDELERLEKETGVIFSNSPTQTVGFMPVSKLPKVTHRRPLCLLYTSHSSFPSPGTAGHRTAGK